MSLRIVSYVVYSRMYSLHTENGRTYNIRRVLIA